MPNSNALEGKIPDAKALILGRNDPNIKPDRIRQASHIKQIVLHTTGWGLGHERIWKKYKQGKITLQEFGEMYASFQSRLQYNPHGTVTPTGELFQFAPFKYRTHHTGSGKRLAYANGSWLKKPTKPMGWWQDRFPTLKSPLDLPGWEPFRVGRKMRYSINSRSIAFDLIPAGGQYTDEQYDKLAEVVAYTLHELDIPADRFHVVDHSEIAPLDRTNTKGPWDFGNNFDWNKFWSMVEIEYTLYRGKKDIPFKQNKTKSTKAMLYDMGYYKHSCATIINEDWSLVDEEALVKFKEENKVSIGPSDYELDLVSNLYLLGHFIEL